MKKILFVLFFFVVQSSSIYASNQNEIFEQIASAFTYTDQYKNLAIENLEFQNRVSKISYLTSPLTLNGSIRTDEALSFSFDLNWNLYDGGYSNYDRNNAYLLVENNKIKTLIAARQFMFDSLTRIIQLKQLDSQMKNLQQMQAYYKSIGLDSTRVALQEDKTRLQINRLKYYLMPVVIDIQSFELDIIGIPKPDLENVELEKIDLVYQLNRIAKDRNEQLGKLKDNFRLDIAYSTSMQKDSKLNHSIKISAKIDWDLDPLLSIKSTLEVTPSQMTSFSYIRSDNILFTDRYVPEINLNHDHYLHTLDFLYREYNLACEEKNILWEELIWAEQELYPLSINCI